MENTSGCVGFLVTIVSLVLSFSIWKYLDIIDFSVVCFPDNMAKIILLIIVPIGFHKIVGLFFVFLAWFFRTLFRKNKNIAGGK
ncbi:hypothetical protein PGS62_07650 [Yersinia rochesterensis]|uniref:hypothetical protein n=1 Tax=Yersinia TaxID=629 RepID=UPI00223F55AA|nr:MULTISPECIES: hypothetical protein [Yersinia]MDA5543820.1 hypothetical protein [Yersinia rochesterensis]UZM74474.1 hypothetical protein OP863_16245 [Yersinia sp. SCPM-O-B-9106 (C-191)]